MWRGALAFAVISAVGALVGSLILLSLRQPVLRRHGAVAAAWPPPPSSPPGRGCGPQKLAEQSDDRGSSLAGRIVQFFTSIYGGFFGAGMGVMMLATLGLTEGGDYHRLNALKNLLSIVIAAVAIVVFASGGVVAWLQAAVMVPGVAIGGYAGVWTARRVPQSPGRAACRRRRPASSPSTISTWAERGRAQVRPPLLGQLLAPRRAAIWRSCRGCPRSAPRESRRPSNSCGRV